jgi:hypothetical protein
MLSVETQQKPLEKLPEGRLRWEDNTTVDLIELNGKFLHFRRDNVSKPRSFYKAGIEKLVARCKTVIASNGNYIID